MDVYIACSRKYKVCKSSYCKVSHVLLVINGIHHGPEYEGRVELARSLDGCSNA